MVPSIIYFIRPDAGNQVNLGKSRPFGKLMVWLFAVSIAQYAIRLRSGSFIIFGLIVAASPDYNDPLMPGLHLLSQVFLEPDQSVQV